MYFRQILHEEKACISYLVGCPTFGPCAVVDPQGDPETYIDQVKKNELEISVIIETHVHADHLSCARELAALTGVPLYLGPGADVRYEHVPLADGQVLEVGNRLIQAIHTPGHTPEHICLLVDDWFVLTGDTLFVGDVGRVDLALNDVSADEIRARAVQLYHGLNRLLELSDWTEIYPGHYEGSVCGRGIDGKTISTIGYERRSNPALQLSADAFADFQIEGLPPLPADFHIIKRRNLGYEGS
ncbi:MAG: MBL fold metallo-hydrolase [Candidatus Bipolaricaulia bacterium]